MKLLRIYKENQELKSKLEDLSKEYDIVSNQNDMVFKKIDYYKYKFEEEEKTSPKLRYKVCELLHQNIDLLEENAELLEEKKNKSKERNDSNIKPKRY